MQYLAKIHFFNDLKEPRHFFILLPHFQENSTCESICLSLLNKKSGSSTLLCHPFSLIQSTLFSLEPSLHYLQISEKLGEYPHAKIQAVKKKQSTRMIKHVCENDCGAIIYASRKQSEENPVLCANCSGWDECADDYQEVYMVEA